MIVEDRRSLLRSAKVVHPSNQICGLLLRLDRIVTTMLKLGNTNQIPTKNGKFKKLKVA